MSSTITTAGTRDAVLNLVSGAITVAKLEKRLITGLRVSSPDDDATAYYKAFALSNRATDFSKRKLEIDQGISNLKAGVDGSALADTILKQMKGLVNTVRTADSTTRSALSSQFSDLTRQINTAIHDGSFSGLNLVDNSSATMTVYFNQITTASLTVNATNLLASKLLTTMGTAASTGGLVALGNMLQAAAGGTAIAGFSVLNSQAALSPAAVLDGVSARIDRGISRIRSASALMSGSITFLQSRLNFTDDYMTTLNDGAGKLTNANLDEDGAALACMLTRQQIGIQAVSITTNQQSSMLQLLH